MTTPLFLLPRNGETFVGIGIFWNPDSRLDGVFILLADFHSFSPANIPEIENLFYRAIGTSPKRLCLIAAFGVGSQTVLPAPCRPLPR